MKAFLRAAAASLEGVEVIEQARPRGQGTDSSAEESSGREQETAGSEPLATWNSANGLSSYRIQQWLRSKTPDETHRKLEASSCCIRRKSSISNVVKVEWQVMRRE